MAGESKTANRIANNIVAVWRQPLLQNNYEIYAHDVKAEVKQGGIYRYPDLMVAHETDDLDDYIVKEAVIMVEVASENSMRRDTVTKLKEYTGMASVQYYLVVSQDEMLVQLYYRNGKDLSFIIFEEPQDWVILPNFGIQIMVSEIYDRVKFI